MTTSLLSLVLSALLLAPAAPVRFGGWATITLDVLPSRLVAGQPVQMVFLVKQHGKTPLDGLKPTVAINSGGPVTRVAALPGKSKGQYIASVTFPAAGKWNVTIHSGFAESKITLNPLTVAQAGVGPASK